MRYSNAEERKKIQQLALHRVRPVLTQQLESSHITLNANYLGGVMQVLSRPLPCIS